MDGDSLEAALRDYGPAAIDDLLPRLRTIAEDLDAAHAADHVHGSLHPQNIFVSADHTRVEGLDAAAPVEPAVRAPYSAPEVVAGGDAVAASDQFALAAIAFEWMYGRRISGPAVRPVEVRAIPGVDRDALSRAFTRALAPQAADRFASCMAFCAALEGAVIPVLPLGGDADEDALEAEFLPEDGLATPIDVDIQTATPASAVSELAIDDDLAFDDELVAERPAAFEPPVSPEPFDKPDDLAAPIAHDWSAPADDEGSPSGERLSPASEPVTSWQPSAAYTPAKPADRFSGTMLIVAALVGMVVGFAAGYMARPRALQSAPIATGMAGETGAPDQAGEPGRDGTDAAIPAPSPAPAPARQAAGPAQPAAPTPAPAPAQSASIGRLLVRSTPAGASVEVDGVARGVTPLALRDLELGSRSVTITRRGYIAEERRIALTKARPSRSLEVRLTAEPSAAPRPSTPATFGQRPARGATGTLLIESRPAGATVTVDGKPRGVTPVTLESLAPGDYRIGLSLPGYQSFSTTVRVVAGERTRAAASLSVQEQE